MTNYTYDNKSILRDGKRWFPVMGEIHYSRYPESEWKEALLKMREGGVDIVSSYVIWIHHEEIEGQFDWTGCRNLRKFVETIGECGLSMWLRIGPWSHAEARNGGFPDWLLAKCPEVRTNNDAYLAEVQKFYSEIYKQVEGLFLKDGGPIVGVQIENEYGHCGGLTGAEGEKHMQILTDMAKKTGFDVPMYTATGWGGAVTAGLLPVMGGYCEAPWDQRLGEIEPSGNYVFTYERNDHAIGCDFGLGEGITFDMEKFPYLTAELGGGLQVSHKRRPVARGKDIGGMSIAKIGSGCNLLGYYMYHGGQNPEGKLTTLEENTATGYLNDMSVKNYDFRAPLGEYGEPNESYGEIKLFSIFVKDFGEELCGMDTFIPESNPLKPENDSELRTSWRHNGKSGYVFVNNFQRRRKMSSHKNVVLENIVEGKKISFPVISEVKDGEFFFVPFNMKTGNAVLKTSLATPLCKTNSDFVFYSENADTKVSSIKDCGSLFEFEGQDDSVKVVLLSRKDALKAHKVQSAKKDYLIITDSVLFQEQSGEKIKVHVTDTTGNIFFDSYPELPKAPEGFKREELANGFTRYTYNGQSSAVPEVKFMLEETKEDGTKIFGVSVASWDARDVFVSFDYEGDEIRLYENGKLLDDQFWHGKNLDWTVGLRRYGSNAHDFKVEVIPLKKDAPIFIEEWPEFNGDAVCDLKGVTAAAKTEVVFEL